MKIQIYIYQFIQKNIVYENFLVKEDEDNCQKICIKIRNLSGVPSSMVIILNEFDDNQKWFKNFGNKEISTIYFNKKYLFAGNFWYKIGNKALDLFQKIFH